MDECHSSVCRVVEGRGVCERAFDTFKCEPAAMPDKPFFDAAGLPGVFDLMDNDRVFGHRDDFVCATQSPPPAGLSVSGEGSLTAAQGLATGIHRVRYRLCLKSGAWCSAFTDVAVFVLGPLARVAERSAEAEPGLVRVGQSSRGSADVAPYPATLTPVECRNSTISNRLCPSQFNEGCPYGYDDNWECVPPPVVSQCKQESWEQKLARLWLAYFGDRTLVNTYFDGLLRQPPCTTCTQGDRVT